MDELTFDQLSPEEKADVVAFYNRLGMNTQMSESARAFLESEDALIAQEQSSSWRDKPVATEVSPTIGIMNDPPDMDEVQAFQGRNGLPRDGIVNEATARAMAAQSLAQSSSADGSPVTYTIQGGDTFSKIASENTFTLDQLKAANPDIADFNNVMVGQEINLPVEGAPVVEAPVEEPADGVAALVEEAADTPPDVNDPRNLTIAPNVDIAQVEEADTTEEVIDTVADAVPKELSQNPVKYIVDNNLRGLDERNPLGAEAIRGFFRTATRSNRGPESAWCAVFVDHVLRGIGAPVMARDQVSIDPVNRGTVGTDGAGRAREYENYGTGVELDDIKAGDLVILKGSNRGSGHIGFYTGKKDENGRYLVLGGNQSSDGDGRSREDLAQLVAGVVGQESLTTRQLQQIVGADVDGAYGPATERNVRQWLRTQGVMNEAPSPLNEKKRRVQGVSVNVSPYDSSKFAAVRRIENIQDLPVDVMKKVTADITGNGLGDR